MVAGVKLGIVVIGSCLVDLVGFPFFSGLYPRLGKQYRAVAEVESVSIMTSKLSPQFFGTVGRTPSPLDFHRWIDVSLM